MAVGLRRVAGPAIGYLENLVPASLDVQEPDQLAVVPAEPVDTGKPLPGLLHPRSPLSRLREVAPVVVAVRDVVVRTLRSGRVDLLEERDALLEGIESPAIAFHR